ncbi:hypothetical protein QCA50_007206 [Cerrena zonata]|uniref:Uncharacterized protein n=1 Tax=Cerrena zonata TaxID=2478898 RepID=A0AAW0GCM9_9APHY
MKWIFYSSPEGCLRESTIASYAHERNGELKVAKKKGKAHISDHMFTPLSILEAIFQKDDIGPLLKNICGYIRLPSRTFSGCIEFPSAQQVSAIHTQPNYHLICIQKF